MISFRMTTEDLDDQKEIKKKQILPRKEKFLKLKSTLNELKGNV